jgi:uncharacterized cofD-like protein
MLETEEAGKKIVVLGGGTGLYTLLTGLKFYTPRITAVVSMSDSGGSSGILRDSLGVLPPGDIRRCLVALSKKEQFWRRIFDIRFGNENHAIGNIILSDLEKDFGCITDAIKFLSEQMDVVGHVMPVTLDKGNLYAILENGEKIIGETNIDIPKHDPNLKIKEVGLEPRCFIYREASERLLNADSIVLSSGDLYTSVIPNLLVKGVKDAINNSKAKKIYICNIMTKYGETNNFKTSDFVFEIEKYLENKLDYVILNKTKPSQDILDRYKEENSEFVEPDLESTSGRKVILEDLLSTTDFSRHNPKKLGYSIINLTYSTKTS